MAEHAEHYDTSVATVSDNVEAKRDPAWWPVAYYGAITILLTIATIFFVEFLYYSGANREVEQKIYSVNLEWLSNIRSKNLAQVNSYRVVDRGKGDDPRQFTVAIPIDDAIAIATRELAAGRDPVQAQAQAEIDAANRAGLAGQSAPADSAAPATEQGAAGAEGANETQPTEPGGGF